MTLTRFATIAHSLTSAFSHKHLDKKFEQQRCINRKGTLQST